MYDTLSSEPVKLIDTEPGGKLSSTGYVPVNLGEKHLALQQGKTAAPFIMGLEAGDYSVLLYSITTRETKLAS